ncbi:MAG: hypothetical protein AAF567_01565 [Actinomycetota bacterium]
MLLVLPVLNVARRWRPFGIVLGALVLVLLASACSSDPQELAQQTQVVSVTPSPVPTTPPLVVPTPSPVPTPEPVIVPGTTPTPVPTPTVAPTVEPTPTADPAGDAAASSDSAPEPTATAAAEPELTATPIPTATPEPEGDGDTAAAEATPEPTTEPTAEAETPTAVVVASGEAPLECYDTVVEVYRAYVEGVDTVSFEAGRVYCTGAGTNSVSAARSYRHTSGLIVQRNGDFILNDAGTGYTPYSGTMFFCVDGQGASSPITSNTVPTLLIVIDNEAARLVAEGATPPASFDGNGPRC